jgi:hypothetical protein
MDCRGNSQRPGNKGGDEYMKVHLALQYKGINHSYHYPLWHRALRTLGWEQTTVEKADVTVMWGPNREFEDTRKRDKPVLMVDFPYWNRGGKLRDGREFYKVSLNGQHPTPYVMQETHTPARYRATSGPVIQPWRSGGHNIMLAGMGMKAARQFGYGVGEWERRTVELLRAQTKKPIIYRPKPKQVVERIPGTAFDTALLPIEEAMKNTELVCCHHGNPTVAALAMGIPIFMNGKIGVASHFASFDFADIKHPIKPDGREQFFYNLAHWQWSVKEIESGQALLSYRDRGLI